MTMAISWYIACVQPATMQKRTGKSAKDLSRPWSMNRIAPLNPETGADGRKRDSVSRILRIEQQATTSSAPTNGIHSRLPHAQPRDVHIVGDSRRMEEI